MISINYHDPWPIVGPASCVDDAQALHHVAVFIFINYAIQFIS